ncbi:proline-rich protein 27 [Elephas maximus indicus]|uniref:proline-rich protein 27 n=1 Tax=Elephas maximus indicus TaxID=99487 RepID=UPI002116BCA0|nr:proline-rich protein 27 [Elephas maximus indicus]
MKLLLWACFVCVAFARKRLPFFREKLFSSSEEDYNGNHLYPLKPSLNSPYRPPVNYLPPHYYPSQYDVPNYPEFPKPGEQVPPFPWVLTAPGAPAFYPNPNFPPAAWLVPPPPPPPPAGPSSSVPPARNPEAPAAQPPSVEPAAANSAVAEPAITEPAAATPVVPESQFSVS